MLTRAKLDKINERPHGGRRSLWPLIAAATAALSLAALLLLSPYIALALLLAGSVTLLLAYRKDREAMPVPLSYAALDPESTARFAGISEALSGLASSEKVWSVSTKPERPQGARHTASLTERGPARVGLLGTPGISADVEVWGVEARGQRALFFPEGLLVYHEGRYKAISYGSLKVSFSDVRLGEEEGVPQDAEVVGRTRRYVREDGTPDRRRVDNPEIPVVLYGRLEIVGPSGLEVRLLVSNCKAARGVARTFVAGEGSGDTPPKESGSGTKKTAGDGARRPDRSPAELQAAARKTLGVGPLASMREVTTAYRRMARLYHPDKAEGLSPEEREAAEGRMKEINAAYSELKLHG